MLCSMICTIWSTKCRQQLLLNAAVLHWGIIILCMMEVISSVQETLTFYKAEQPLKAWFLKRAYSP